MRVEVSPACERSTGAPSAFSLAAAAVRLAGRTGMLGGVELAERYLKRELVLRP